MAQKKIKANSKRHFSNRTYNMHSSFYYMVRRKETGRWETAHRFYDSDLEPEGRKMVGHHECILQKSSYSKIGKLWWKERRESTITETLWDHAWSQVEMMWLLLMHLTPDQQKPRPWPSLTPLPNWFSLISQPSPLRKEGGKEEGGWQRRRRRREVEGEKKKRKRIRREKKRGRKEKISRTLKKC